MPEQRAEGESPWEESPFLVRAAGQQKLLAVKQWDFTDMNFSGASKVRS